MHAIWIIARRELDSFFDSLIAYIMLVLFLGFSGFFTWLLGVDIFLVGQATLQSFFDVAYWTLFFFIPALTMRLLAEEKKTGTLELLLTKAVSDRQVVLGKFLSAFLLVLIALAFTFPYVVTVANLGNIDAGQILCGYLGLVLMSAMYISIGLYTSSITSNQLAAWRRMTCRLVAKRFMGDSSGLVRPGVAQGHAAVEHRGFRTMVAAVGDEIAEAFELERLFRRRAGRGRFDVTLHHAA